MGIENPLEYKRVIELKNKNKFNFRKIINLELIRNFFRMN